MFVQQKKSLQTVSPLFVLLFEFVCVCDETKLTKAFTMKIKLSMKQQQQNMTSEGKKNEREKNMSDMQKRDKI